MSYCPTGDLDRILEGQKQPAAARSFRLISKDSAPSSVARHRSRHSVTPRQNIESVDLRAAIRSAPMIRHASARLDHRSTPFKMALVLCFKFDVHVLIAAISCPFVFHSDPAQARQGVSSVYHPAQPVGLAQAWGAGQTGHAACDLCGCSPRKFLDLMVSRTVV